jgi:ABC-type multidrug transport system permease subunit
MKTIPLVKTNLKGFVRRWKFIFLLIIFPFILISTVFLSFNPEGLQKIPVGVILKSETFDMQGFEDEIGALLILNKFENKEDCIYQLKSYIQYACVEISGERTFLLDVYFDNTREPVIWEIIGKIKGTVDLIQKRESKKMASGFLGEFKSEMTKLDDLESRLDEADSDMDSYIHEIDRSITKLKSAKSDLKDALDTMDSDISEVKSQQSSIKSREEYFYTTAVSYLDSMGNNIESLNVSYPNTIYLYRIVQEKNNLKNQVSYFDNYFDSQISVVDNRVANYEDYSQRGRSYITEIDNSIVILQNMKSDLQDYKQDIGYANQELSGIRSDLKLVTEVDPETLVNPITVKNKPAYVPVERFNVSDAEFGDIVKGANLISLQVLFPTVLLLIVIFLSILVSSFICLNDINSHAAPRLQLVSNIFLPQFLAVYVSSLIIVAVPVLCVVLVGEFIFNIPLFANMHIVTPVLFLVTSIFVLLGLGISYLVKKESITLLIINFVLIFLIFFSGFILPAEGMSDISSFITTNSPGKVSLTILYQTVFHNSNGEMLPYDFSILIGWFIALLSIVLVIKKVRKL